MVFYLILVLKDRKWLPQKHPFLIVFALFTLFFGITTVTSINPYLSFWGSLERMGGLWSFIHYLIYFVILISIFKTREDWTRLLELMIFVGVLSAIYGFGQKTNLSFFLGSGDRARIFGTIGNAALFAGYQVVTLFTALTLAISSWIKPKLKGYLLIAALINGIAIMMTAVRGSILGLFAGLFVFVFLYAFVLNSRRAKQAVLSLIGIFVLFLIFAFAFKDSSFVKNSNYLSRITSISPSTMTVQTRFWAWHAGIQGWEESAKTILFGWGPENFDVPFSRHFNPKFFNGIGSETLFDRAHNMFVEVLVTMGALTFIVYLGMFVLAYRLLWLKIIKGGGPNAKIGMGLVALITAYIIHNSFIFDTSANFIVFFTIFGFATWLTSFPAESSSVSASNSKTAVSHKLGLSFQTLMIILLGGAGFLIYWTNVRASEANYANTRGIVASWANDFDGALAKFKESMSYDVPGKYDYRDRYAEFILQYISSKTTLNQKELDAVILAITEVQKNADENKDDYLPYLYISRLYVSLGKSDPKSPFNDLALQNSMKALEISPTFVRTYYEIAQDYLNKKDYASAIKYFNEAAQLNPDVALTYWYLAATYLEVGDTQKGLVAVDQADKLGYQFAEADLIKLLGIYIKMQDYPKIIRTYENLIKIKPANAQYHASLAAAYATVGNIDQAVSEAHKATQLDPSFEAQARAFVQSLGRQY